MVEDRLIALEARVQALERFRDQMRAAAIDLEALGHREPLPFPLRTEAGPVFLQPGSCGHSAPEPHDAATPASDPSSPGPTLHRSSNNSGPSGVSQLMDQTQNQNSPAWFEMVEAAKKERSS